jgi:hypothetical protein
MPRSYTGLLRGTSLASGLVGRAEWPPVCGRPAAPLELAPVTRSSSPPRTRAYDTGPSRPLVHRP